VSCAKSVVFVCLFVFLFGTIIAIYKCSTLMKQIYQFKSPSRKINTQMNGCLIIKTVIKFIYSVKLKTSQVNVMTSSIQIRINKLKRSMTTTTTYVFKNPHVYRFKIMSVHSTKNVISCLI
jgi:hypothetical protein